MIDLWPLLVPLMLLIVATVHDLRSREIPNWIGLALLLWAGVVLVSGLNPDGWLSIVAGFGLGVVVSLVLYAARAFGGGDVKLVTALGAAVGLRLFVFLLLWTALAGAGLSLAARLRGQRTLAYAPALTLGYLLLLVQVGLSTKR